MSLTAGRINASKLIYSFIIKYKICYIFLGIMYVWGIIVWRIIEGFFLFFIIFFFGNLVLLLEEFKEITCLIYSF